MKFKYTFFLLFSLLFISNAYSIEYDFGESQDIKLQISGYLDLNYMYMEEMPMAMVHTMPNGMRMPMIMAMDEQSSIDPGLNLLLHLEKDKLRFNVNIDGSGSYDLDESESESDVEVLEAYGEYLIKDGLKIRAGTFLSPFGTYNDKHYILPLYSTVVLPFIYRMPGNYRTNSFSDNPLVSSNFTPSNSNVMLLGTFFFNNFEINYNLYFSNGQKNSNGQSADFNEGIGGKLSLLYNQNLDLSFSYYKADNGSDMIGDETLYALSARYYILENLFIESEFVKDDFKTREDRHSWYTRATMTIKKYEFFIGYDNVKDKANLLYKRGHLRYTTGLSYNLNKNFLLKGEFHYHKFKDENKAPALPDGTEQFNMFLCSVIFKF